MPSVGQQPYNTTIKNYSKVMFVTLIHGNSPQISPNKGSKETCLS